MAESKAQETPKPQENSEDQGNSENQEPDSENQEPKKEVLELPPFEIVTGEKMSPFFFKFQFKNVEYSSGRNKTFLCYSVEIQGSEDESFHGYLEDEHASAHAEEAFFNEILPECKSELRYKVTWYVSSSPCAACAAKIAGVVRKHKNLRLSILAARLFMWEEPEIQDGLRQLKAAGCKLKMMAPQDFVHTWKTFVEQEGEDFVPWEEIQENTTYYEEKLAEILKTKSQFL
ncbi:C-_U-editing enzyme APOBEC-2 [Latimeria chalumnae]|uniref:mRNA(cytosine(6666)) deaminase n=1 Tax=Latimeria chalumnae TaxID=7897 RepID=H3B8C5_LATCH|nr:PREDICTED: C->U-editing enzyme APOBEC-2 [Latimeria chalumnae]|eukprot:XP_005995520.1 PREDICTED: C-_U-editing enzyme APOBEC-2 [Latimeria chalumnae]